MLEITNKLLRNDRQKNSDRFLSDIDTSAVISSCTIECALKTLIALLFH